VGDFFAIRVVDSKFQTIIGSSRYQKSLLIYGIGYTYQPI
jgi:hypothetical protein